MNNRPFLFVVTGIVAVGVVGAVLATMVDAATSMYAVKVTVTDKIQSANVFEGTILEQTSGKTSILGDRMNFRLSSTTKAGNSVGKTQSVKSWIGALQNGDAVTAVGQYKKADNTFEVNRVVNRSR